MTTLRTVDACCEKCTDNSISGIWCNDEDCPCHTPSSEIGEQTDFSETNTTAIAFLQKCLENGHRLRIDDIEITEYKQERVVSLKPSPAFIHTHIENARREERERIQSTLKGHIMSAVDFAMYCAKGNMWDVDQREKYAQEVEEKLIALSNPPSQV